MTITLLQALLENPYRAGVLLREQLPAEVAERLADAPPQPVEGAFVDESLRGTHSDRATRERQILAYIARRFPTTQAAFDAALK